MKTASVITDAAGNIKAESDYYPWGGELQFVNNDSNDYKFTGKKRDIETGLDYFGARYYSNGLGRWVSADWSSTPVPVPYADFYNPQTLNLYQFVGGNPASKADPDGHCPPCDVEEEPAVQEPATVVTEKTAATSSASTSGEASATESIWSKAVPGGPVIAGTLGGFFAKWGIEIQTDINNTLADAEWQENVAANKLTQAQAKAQADIEAARKSSKTTRREWEKAKGKKWPKDKDGNNYDADHKKALADGGSNNAARNIQPRTRKDHINRHKKNGDFRRWAKRRKKTN